MPIGAGPASGAQRYPTAADLSSHAADTTAIHGITDTSALVTATSLDALRGVWIDVTHADYGATGDGTTDDTAAIQAALDAVDTNAGLVDVWIPDGTYMIDGIGDGTDTVGYNPATNNLWKNGGLVILKSGTRLHMAPNAILKLIPHAQPASAVIYIGHEADHVLIEGGQILGDRATHDYETEPLYTTHEQNYLLVVHGASDVTIERVKISASTGDGIFIDPENYVSSGASYLSPYRTVIRDCVIDGSRRNNISILGCEHVLIEGCTISRAGYDDGNHDGTAPRSGIDVESNGVSEDPFRITVRNNHFTENVSASCIIYNAEQSIVTGNYSDNSLALAFSTEVIITDNIVEDLTNTTGYGISTGASQTAHANSIISGNVVSGFGTGIITQRDAVTIQNNWVHDFTSTGIAATTTDQVLIQNNQISDGVSTTAEGVRVSTSTGTHVVGNRILNVGTGIEFSGTSTGASVRNNSITKATLGVDIAAACEVLVKGNTTNLAGHSAGQSYDMIWRSTSQVVCEANTFRGSTSYAINATSGGSGGITRIIGNRIIGATGGVSIYCTNGAPELVGNTIIHDRATGVTGSITVTGAAGSRLLGNTIYNIGAGAVVGIHTDTATTSNIAGNVIDGTITSDATDTLTNNSLI